MFNEQMKVVIIGETNVGKSSILIRFVSDTFSDIGTPTLGVAYIRKTLVIKGIEVQFNLWDTAGQEKYGPLTKLFSRDADAVIFVYDITSRETFKKIDYWYKLFTNENSEQNIIFAVVGNKEDLIESEEIPIEEAKDYSKSIKAIYIKTSAKQNVGIKELFVKIGERLLERRIEKSKQSIRIDKQSHSKIIRKKCC